MRNTDSGFRTTLNRCASAVCATLWLLAAGCQDQPPPPGDTPGGGSSGGIPPLTLPTCPDKTLAGWTPVGRIGVDDHVWDLAAADEKSPLGPALFACGNFLKADGLTVNHVARWDGAKWSALSGPDGTGMDAPCAAIKISPIDGLLYAGGRFEKAGGEFVLRFAKWDGTEWSDDALRLDSGTLYDLQFHDITGGPDPELIAGGTFDHGGQLLFNGLAWTASGGQGNLGQLPLVGVDEQGEVLALETYRSELVIAGHFGQIGALKTNNIARLANLTSFAALADGVAVGFQGSQVIQDMAVYNGELYVGGLFNKASGVWASNLARWNGKRWLDVKVGADHIVEGVEAANIGDGMALYVAGFFESVGKSHSVDHPSSSVEPVAAQYIARYQNGTWSALGAGLGPNEQQSPPSSNHGMVMEPWDDGNGTCLYVGGRFQTAGNVNASNIARWCCSN